MATLSTFSTLPFIPRTTPTSSINITTNTLSFKYPQVLNFNNPRGIKVSRLPRLSKVRASVVEEQETLIPDEQAAEASQPSVSVSVSPSDILTMFFQVLPHSLPPLYASTLYFYNMICMYRVGLDGELLYLEN